VHLGRSLTLLVLVVATAASCGGGEEAITPEDLPRIVLQANEAPPGTAKAAQVGGAQDLDAFARDAAEREALVADGFVQGYVVYFAPSEFFDPQVDVGPEAVSELARPLPRRSSEPTAERIGRRRAADAR
jgi:hypothetical protein